MLNWDLRRATILLFVCAGFVFFLWMISGFIATLLVAIAYSLSVKPIVLMISKPWLIPIRLSAVITIVLTVILCGIPTLLLSWKIVEEASKLPSLIPFVTRSINELLSVPLPEWIPYTPDMDTLKRELVKNLGSLVEATFGGVMKVATPMTKGVVMGALNFFIFVYSSFFFLTEGDNMMKTTYRFLPFTDRDKELFSKSVISMVRSTVKSILIIGVVQAILVGVGFAVSGVPNPILWSSLVVITSAIPGLGASVVWWPGVIYLLANEKYGWAIGLIVWGLFVVGWIDNILRPRIISLDTSMPDLYIFLSTIGGILVFGPLGLVAGPMIAAVFDASLSLLRTSFFEKDPVGEENSDPTLS